MNRILIVEDEKPISNLIKTNLSDAGYHCTCAFDGEEAANLIEKESFDLILLDIMLPKINGYELIEYIKNFKTPVIFLTAKSDVLDKVKGLKLGAEDYLTNRLKSLSFWQELKPCYDAIIKMKRCSELMMLQSTPFPGS